MASDVVLLAKRMYTGTESGDDDDKKVEDDTDVMESEPEPTRIPEPEAKKEEIVENGWECYRCHIINTGDKCRAKYCGLSRRLASTSINQFAKQMRNPEPEPLRAWRCGCCRTLNHLVGDAVGCRDPHCRMPRLAWKCDHCLVNNLCHLLHCQACGIRRGDRSYENDIVMIPSGDLDDDPYDERKEYIVVNGIWTRNSSNNTRGWQCEYCHSFNAHNLRQCRGCSFIRGVWWCKTCESSNPPIWNKCYSCKTDKNTVPPDEQYEKTTFIGAGTRNETGKEEESDEELESDNELGVETTDMSSSPTASDTKTTVQPKAEPESEPEPESEANEDNLCKVCLDKKQSCAFYHSDRKAHLCVCLDCMNQIDGQNGTQRCPMCNNPYIDCFQLYTA